MVVVKVRDERGAGGGPHLDGRHRSAGRGSPGQEAAARQAGEASRREVRSFPHAGTIAAATSCSKVIVLIGYMNHAHKVRTLLQVPGAFHVGLSDQEKPDLVLFLRTL